MITLWDHWMVMEPIFMVRIPTTAIAAITAGAIVEEGDTGIEAESLGSTLSCNICSLGRKH